MTFSYCFARLIPMSTHSSPTVLHVKRLFRSHPRSNQRGTLRDLYTFGLMSVFRRDSVLRVWEPLRETPHREGRVMSER